MSLTCDELRRIDGDILVTLNHSSGAVDVRHLHIVLSSALISITAFSSRPNLSKHLASNIEHHHGDADADNVGGGRNDGGHVSDLLRLGQ